MGFCRHDGRLDELAANDVAEAAGLNDLDSPNESLGLPAFSVVKDTFSRQLWWESSQLHCWLGNSQFPVSSKQWSRRGFLRELLRCSGASDVQLHQPKR
jgi:hypothetical protein